MARIWPLCQNKWVINTSAANRVLISLILLTPVKNGTCICASVQGPHQQSQRTFSCLRHSFVNTYNRREWYCDVCSFPTTVELLVWFENFRKFSKKSIPGWINFSIFCQKPATAGSNFITKSELSLEKRLFSIFLAIASLRLSGSFRSKIFLCCRNSRFFYSVDFFRYLLHQAAFIL